LYHFYGTAARHFSITVYAKKRLLLSVEERQVFGGHFVFDGHDAYITFL
jgi:hypothetical protein